MEFEWDENKNKSNIDKHGIDFEQAKELFKDENKIEIPDKRSDYGEERTRLIAKAYDLILSSIYTMRGAVVRFISVRLASKAERKLYNSKKKDNDNNKEK